MLITSGSLKSVDGVLAARLDDTEHWQQVDFPGATTRYLGLSFGEPEHGPVIFIAEAPPGFKDPVHSHRTDTFRMTVGSQSRQIKNIGVWMGENAFLLTGANVKYQETVSEDGGTIFVVNADRRGQTSDFAQGPVPYEAQEAMIAAMFGADTVPPSGFYTSEDDAVHGLRSTFGLIPPRRAKLFGTFDEDEEWSLLSDGSRVGAVLMADAVSGPLVLLSNNTPGAVEAPAGSYPTDTVRLILKGSCRVGDRTYGAKEFVVTDAGVEQGHVVHGSEGSSQVLIFADRRAWLPEASSGDAIAECPRLGEIAAVVGPFIDSAAEVAHVYA